MRIVLFSKNTLIGMLLFVTFCVNAASFDRTKSAILVDDTNINDPLKLKQVFAQILVNNTGETISDILNNSVFLEANIKSGLKRSYVEQIENRYLSENSPYHYWFYAVMQEKYIDKIIAQANFSVLPHKREKVMVWVAIDQIQNELGQVNKELAYAYQDELSMYWLERWAGVMGINMVLPKMDEIDAINVSAQSIKSMSFEAQKQAQSRYFVAHNLLLYLDKQSKKIKARLGYAVADGDIAIAHYQDFNNDMGSVLYSVIDDLTNRYAQQYKIDSANIQRHTVQIVINNLSSYDDVMKAEDYLRHLSVIDGSTIVSATNSQLIITSELTVTTKSFLTMIKRDGLLSHSDQGSINQLVLRYNQQL